MGTCSYYKRSKTLYLDNDLLDMLENEGYAPSEYVNNLLREALDNADIKGEIAKLQTLVDDINEKIVVLDYRRLSYVDNRTEVENRIAELRAEIAENERLEQLNRAMKPLTSIIKLCDFNAEIVEARFADKIQAVKDIDPTFDIVERCRLLKKVSKY